jgi:hypothetical protein
MPRGRKQYLGRNEEVDSEDPDLIHYCVGSLFYRTQSSYLDAIHQRPR